MNTAHALSMKIIAEGIETEETAHSLASHEIEYGQGYLYGRPAPAPAGVASPASAPQLVARSVSGVS